MGRTGEGLWGGRGEAALLDKLIVGGGFDWEGGVVVQTEDDTNKEVGTVPGEDGVRVSWTVNQHPLHDNHLFFFIYISTSCRSPGAE